MKRKGRVSPVGNLLLEGGGTWPLETPSQTLLLVSLRCREAAGGWHQPDTSPLPTGHPIAPLWGSPLHRLCRAQGRRAVVLPSCVPCRRQTMPGTGLEQLLPPSFPSSCKNGA